MNEDKNKIITASSINLIAGVWMLFTPFIFGLTSITFARVAYIVGIILIVVALIRISHPAASHWTNWFNSFLGFLLLISPLALAHLTIGAILNNVIIGIFILIAAVSSFSIADIYPHETSGSSPI
jgi:hypothetical protein